MCVAGLTVSVIRELKRERVTLQERIVVESTSYLSMMCVGTECIPTNFRAVKRNVYAWFDEIELSRC